MKTINIKDTTHKKLKKIADQENLSMSSFLEHSIEYFAKTKVNPKTDIISIKEEIIRLEKRVSQIIGFIKVLESENLIPLYQEMKKTDIRINNLVTTFDETTINIIEEVKRYNQLVAKEIERSNQERNQTEKTIKNVLNNIIENQREANKGSIQQQKILEAFIHEAIDDMFILSDGKKEQRQSVANRRKIDLKTLLHG